MIAGLLLALLLLAGCSADDGAGRLYVASGLTDEVFVLEARDGSLVRTVPVDPRPTDVDEPHGVAVAPDGDFWYATVAHGEPGLWKFDARDDARVGRLRLRQPGAGRIRITPDGARALVPAYWRSGEGRESGLAAVRLEDLRVLDAPTLCSAPHDAPLDPGGGLAAIPCSMSDEVLLLDARSLEVRARTAAGPDPGPDGSPRYRPLNAAWSPSGETAWIGLRGSGEVVAMDRAGRIRERLGVGAAPMQLAVTPDGRLLVVALRDEGAAAILGTDPLRELRRVTLPDAPHPHAVALDEAGARAFVGFEGTVGTAGGVVALGLPDGEVLWRREAGRYTLGVAYAP